MKNRIKELREALNLTQGEFAQKTHISRSMIAGIETGVREIKEIHISQICSTFHVSETWLRTGKGDMLVQSDRSLVGELSREYKLDDVDTAIVESFLSLPDEYRKGVKEYMLRVLARVQSGEEDSDDLLRAKLDAAIDEHLHAERPDSKDA